MNGIDPKYVFYLGILVTIQTAIGQGAVSLTNVFPEMWIPYVKGWSQFLGFIGTAIMTAMSGASSRNAGPLVKAAILAALLLPAALLYSGNAQAADIPVKAATAKRSALTDGYPIKCGYYFGIGTGGNAGAIDGGVVGAQIVQGDLSAIVGYTCPFAGNAFWFAEASFGFSNLNGRENGLSLSGPMLFIERFGVGSPINNLLANVLPFNLSPSLPSVPLLPEGVTTSPGNAYVFAGLVEQDIGAQIGVLSGHQWVIAPMIGLGMLTRASNNVMIDTWAGWQMNSDSFCPGGGAACARLGNMARVGVSLKY